VKFASYFDKGYRMIFCLILVGLINLPYAIIAGSKHRLGRLAKKEEAAGKVRIFAITD